MRMLVCGGRDMTDRGRLYDALDEVTIGQSPEIVITGGARGADTLAFEWARDRRLDSEVHPARWQELGKRAGAARNRQMLTIGKPDLVVAFPTEQSRGTWNMVEIARAAGVEVILR